MFECDNCLTNVAGLCSHCKKCSICCEENKCFGCQIIIPTLRELGVPEKVLQEIQKESNREYGF